MMTLQDVAVLLIQATADCERWTRLVKDLALSEDAELPTRIAQANGLRITEISAHHADEQPVKTLHLRQIIVSRMEAAEREFQILYNTQLQLVSCGKADEPADESAPPRVHCAACDRGDYQLGHADDCPKAQ